MNNVSLGSQILLVAFVTGLIFYYSRILSQIIGKLKCPSKRLNWHVKVATLLMISIGLLCLDAVTLIIRILFLNQTFIWLDQLIIGAIGIVFFILTIVYFISFCNIGTLNIIYKGCQKDNIKQKKRIVQNKIKNEKFYELTS